MKSFEYSPLADVKLPYIEYAGLNYRQRARIVWEILGITSLPSVTRWIIIRALRAGQKTTRT